MGKHAKKSKHSDTESDQSDFSSSSSEVERKIRKKHASVEKRKQAASKQSTSSSSSTDSESDSSVESVKKRRTDKTRELKTSKVNNSEKETTKATTDNRSKWDSPAEDKRRQLEQVRTRDRVRSRSRDSRQVQHVRRDDTRRDQRDHKDIDRNVRKGEHERDYREKRNERDYRQNRNVADERHRNERDRSRDNRNSRHDQVKNERDRNSRHDYVKEERDRSRDRMRNRSRDRWQQGRNDQRRGRQDSTHFRNSRSLSPRRNMRRQQRSRSRDRGADGGHAWGKKSEGERRQDKKPTEKEEPNFGLSGALTEDTNKVNGVVVKYAEPPEARRPKRRWRLYPFKGETALPVLHIHRQSCFLVGRERKVVDLAVDHPSCSKQHAALQYRLVSFTREDGSHGKRVRLYLIDLDSANGTFLNNKKIEPRKYYELLEKDVVKFGFSTREYVLLHENSQEDQEDDDVSIKQEPED